MVKITKMKKEVTLVLCPMYPVKFETGTLVAYKKKKLQPEINDYNPFYLTDGMMPIQDDVKKSWMPVEPYLICDVDNDDDSEYDEKELFMFCVNGRLAAGYFDDMLGAGIQWVKKVIAEPEQIGKIDVKSIIKNGESSGKCEVEIIDGKVYFSDSNIYL